MQRARWLSQDDQWVLEPHEGPSSESFSTKWPVQQWWQMSLFQSLSKHNYYQKKGKRSSRLGGNNSFVAFRFIISNDTMRFQIYLFSNRDTEAQKINWVTPSCIAGKWRGKDCSSCLLTPNPVLFSLCLIKIFGESWNWFNLEGIISVVLIILPESFGRGFEGTLLFVSVF